jgi:peptidyl-prolyl cis-trans isomerase SurA
MIIRSLCILLALFITFGFIPNTMAASTEKIVAVVNNGVVTASDLKSRLDLIAASSGLKPSKELNEKLRPQIIDMLVDEQIRLQEAARLGITVDASEIDSGFEQIAKQNNIPSDVFARALQQRGIRVATMRDQIKAQLAWTKVVQKQIRPRIDVKDADIDAELDRLRTKLGKDQYNIAEIFLPFEPSKKSQAENFARQLVSQLKAEPDAFPKAARQFSQSPGANQGRFIGWVGQGVLPEEVDAVLPSLEKGGISNPIVTKTGIYVVMVRDKRALTEADLPSREELTERIGLERMDRAQRRYYIDLKSQAFIDKRG